MFQGDDVTRVLKNPEEIKVTSNIKGVPVSLTRAGKQEKITAIYDKWEEAPEKNYFKIKTSRGRGYDIYHDVPDNRWYLAKIYD
jgi:hypothetical protein